MDEWNDKYKPLPFWVCLESGVLESTRNKWSNFNQPEELDMFIKVTLPQGMTYLRADRIETVMPIAPSVATDPDAWRARSIITMVGAHPEDDGWWVSEDASILMCDIEEILDATT